jgi:hypothetical protein
MVGIFLVNIKNKLFVDASCTYNYLFFLAYFRSQYNDAYGRLDARDAYLLFGRDGRFAWDFGRNDFGAMGHELSVD